jgi:hypothetical protein
MKSNQIEKASFNDFILGLASAALCYLGHGEQVEGLKNRSINKSLASYNIELIKLLEQKTKGNLTEEEKRLMTEVIADLTKKYQSL